MKILIQKSFIILVIILTGIFYPVQIFSQSSAQIAKMESDAKYHLSNDRHHLALSIYLKLDSIHPDSPRYIFPIGVCYLNSSYQEKLALEYFEKCLQHPEKYPPSLNYYAGKAYHLSHRMDEAILYFELYLNQLKKKEKKNKETIDKVNWEIEMCKNGKDLMANPLNVDILNMGPTINSIYPDYAPVLSADQKELIFTSCRPNTTGGAKDQYDGRYHEDLYVSFRPDSSWTEPSNLGDSVNTNGHDASIGLSADGQTLFLYRSNPDPLSFSSGDIYISELNGKFWSKALPLPSSVNSSSYELGASLSPDGRTLYFSSNRSGGYGGMDLYMVKILPNGEWAVPTNLGSKINTASDEDSPFMHSDGKTLYFCSNGHKTMGGFDIFSSSYNEERLDWLEPKNAGYPISTAHDDVHFTWSPDGNKIYFSSIRPEGYGDQDIYYAVIHKDESTEVLVMKGYILDSISKKPVMGQITVTNQQSNKVVGIFNSNSATGKYLVILPEGHYNVTITSDNHKICEQVMDIIELNGFEVLNKDITLCPETILDK